VDGAPGRTDAAAVSLSDSRQLQLAVVVAVVAVRVMQVAIDQIVDVVAVGDRLMAAAGTVLVIGRVSAALVLVATVGIAVAHLDRVLVDVDLVRMVQVAVVQIVDVIAVAHGDMTAVRAMAVFVIAVVGLVALGHFGAPVVGGMKGSAVAGLGNVLQHVVEQRDDVLIGERVIDVLALTAAADKACPQQLLQPRGNAAELVRLLLDQLAYATLALGDAKQQPQAGRISQGSEQATGRLDPCRGRQRRRRSRRVGVAGVWRYIIYHSME
jgi:hypothetical protein